MPKLLTYDGRPVALMEALPCNAYGELRQFTEAEICWGLSPQEGLADLVEVPDEVADRLRAGDPVNLRPYLPSEEEDWEEDWEED